MNTAIAEWCEAHSGEVIDLAQKIWAHPIDLNPIMHLVPTAIFFCFGTVMNTLGHHWSQTACAGMSIGHKGALFAGKCISQCGYDLIKDPSLVDRCWAELRKS